MKTTEDNSKFSEFIRNASATEKEQFYIRVMMEAIEMQEQIIKEAARRTTKA